MARANAPRSEPPSEAGQEGQRSADRQWLWLNGDWRKVTVDGPVVMVDVDGNTELGSVPDIDDPSGSLVLRALRPEDVADLLRGRRDSRNA